MSIPLQNNDNLALLRKRNKICKKFCKILQDNHCLSTRATKLAFSPNSLPLTWSHIANGYSAISKNANIISIYEKYKSYDFDTIPETPQIA